MKIFLHFIPEEKKIIVILLFFFIIGIFLLFITIKKIKLLLDAKNWVSNDAKIIKAKIEVSDDGYIPDIKYEYYVSGKRYVGKNIFPSGLYSSESKKLVIDKIKKYKVSNIIRIYFNPKKPIESCINLEERIANTILLSIITVIFIFLPIYVISKL